jgi:ferredoxin
VLGDERAAVPAHPGGGPVTRLVVDPVACTGHGICADLLPEGITLDEWGYPLAAPGEVPEQVLPAARRAAAACPKRALLLRDGS